MIYYIKTMLEFISDNIDDISCNNYIFLDFIFVLSFTYFDGDNCYFHCATIFVVCIFERLSIKFNGF